MKLIIAAAAPLVAVLLSGAASAQQMDGPRPGKWKTTLTTMGQTRTSDPMCIKDQKPVGDAMKEQASQGAPPGTTCDTPQVTRAGGKMNMKLTCTMAGPPAMKVTNDITLTGDMSSRYEMDMVMTIDPPISGMSSMTSHIVAERLGDC